MFFNSIIGTFVSFIALFWRYLHSKATTLEALHRDLCDLVVGFTSTCLVASRFALDHDVLQRGGHRSLCLSDLQARQHKEDRKPLLRLDVGLIILSTNINMKKKLKTGRVLFLSASSVF